MNKKGIVSKVDGDKLQIVFARSAACGDCSSCGGCEAETINLDANNHIDAKVGDFVEIVYNSKNMLKSTILVYIFPLIMLIIGMVIGMNMNLSTSSDSKELVALAIGVLFMIVSYFIIHMIDKKVNTDQFFTINKVDNIF